MIYCPLVFTICNYTIKTDIKTKERKFSTNTDITTSTRAYYGYS